MYAVVTGHTDLLVNYNLAKLQKRIIFTQYIQPAKLEPMWL